jgi:hypothetical protein
VIRFSPRRNFLSFTLKFGPTLPEAHPEPRQAAMRRTVGIHTWRV